jgi:crossover junction endodeoxyribonuclease RuvC
MPWGSFPTNGRAAMRLSLIIVGIDPGVKGCIALLDVNSGTAQFFAMPVIRYKSQEGKNSTVVDEDGLIKLIRDIAGPHVACTIVERQQAFHRGRNSTTFNIGYGFGVIIGTIKSVPVLACSLALVKPREWKKDFGLIRADEMKTAAFKELSRQLALQIFPGATESLRRKKDENRAEALLIAEWGRRHALRKYIPGYRWRPFQPESKVIAPVCGDAIHRTASI